MKRNVFLVGLMGAGKTTVGRLLARRLRMPFFDSDHEIERRCGVTVRHIFEVEGEARFRERERQTIAELTGRDGIVLATGGGAVLDEENRRCLSRGGTVVYLRASPEALFARVRHDGSRPLLAGGDPLARLRALHEQRDPLYRCVADLVVDTGNQSVPALARDLARRLEERWKAFA